MSTPKRITFSLQLQANAVTCNGIAVPLRHHRAALFLDGLIAAHGQTRAYTKAEFLTAWTALDPLATPDRNTEPR